MFHPEADADKPPAGLGYVSSDGHHFSCKNPILMQQAFHVFVIRAPCITYTHPHHYTLRIFVIDRSTAQRSFPRNYNLRSINRSGSMSLSDRQPLPNSSGIERIVRKANNRLGAVFSALYSFWIARQAAVDRNSSLGGSRKDAYSLIFFNHEASASSIQNDFSSSPDELLNAALDFNINGGTDFTRALEKTEEVMISHWSTERYEPCSV